MTPLRSLGSFTPRYEISWSGVKPRLDGPAGSKTPAPGPIPWMALAGVLGVAANGIQVRDSLG